MWIEKNKILNTILRDLTHDFKKENSFFFKIKAYKKKVLNSLIFIKLIS